MNTKLNHITDWLALAQEANWNVSQMAKLSRVSTRTLQRYFQKTMGKAPKTWVSQQRHNRATILLRDGSSVKETASNVGYSYSNTFAREFKKVSGQCPTNLFSDKRK